MIQPKNNENLVTELLAYMGLDKKAQVLINADAS
jgi:hypothetical protein